MPAVSDRRICAFAGMMCRHRDRSKEKAMSWNECAPKRLKVCDQTAKESYSQCTEERKEGYNRCTQTRDEGYKDCCDWWPCSWACDAWTWISNIVCTGW